MLNSKIKNLIHKEMTRKDFLSFSALTIASLFGVVGVITELLSHAATPYASTEAETGTETGSAENTEDSAASQGKAVQFGSTTPNLLTGDSANFEGGTLGAWANIANGATVTNDTTIAHSGAHSMKIITDADNASGPYTYGFTASSGSSYTFSLWVYATASDGQFAPGIDFYDASHNLLASNATATALTTNTWKELSITATAPTGTAQAYLTAYPTVSVSPSTFYVDDCALSSITSTTPVPTPTTSGMIFGVAMGADEVLFTSSDAGAAQYSIMKADGFSGVRIDVGYQTTTPYYEDTTLRAAINAGLASNTLIILDGYHPNEMTQAQFVTFCTSVVNTYKSLGIHKYEICNEINGNNNWDTSTGYVNPAAYAVLLKACYSAIKVADPTAFVVSSGLAVFDVTAGGTNEGSGNYSSNLAPGQFLTLMYAQMGGDSTGYFDAVGCHPYCYTANPSTVNNWGVMLNPVGGPTGYYGPSMRQIMGTNGDSAKDLWITEYGEPIEGSTTDAMQATYFQDALQLCETYDYVGAFYFFNWADDQDGNYGLTSSSYVAKPALATIQSFMNDFKS
jgi:hypothetical protein